MSKISKNTFFVCFIWLAICRLATPLHAASASPFDEANQLYDQGKFSEAKQRYEQIAAAGNQSANLYFNLGNADFRAGEKGKAILDYERALALDPSHPEALANLRLARDQSGARLMPATWLDRAILPFPADVYPIVAAAAFWIFIWSVAVMIFWRRSESLAAWTALLLALIVGAYSGLALWQDAQQRAIGIVTARETVAHLSPADRSGIAETLPAGSRVRVLSERGEWVYCELPGGTRGWLSAGTVARVRT